MTRLRGLSFDRFINSESLVLVLALLLLATITQGVVKAQLMLNHRDSVLDDTEGDAARGGVCNDSNICTDDTINEADECVFTNNTLPCNDNDVCTTNDRCSNGLCSGIVTNCNDNNECTDDSCNFLGNCVHVNNSDFCNDGSFCNGRDTCRSGSCSSHSGNPCAPNVTCDEVTQSCGLASVISFKAVKINNVAITPGTCNLALAPPKCSTGNINKLCASDAECHVGTNYLIPDKCAGGPNINLGCSTHADCPGSTCISVVAEDTIEVEFFLFRWATDLPAGVRLYQVKLDDTSFVSPDNGTVLPMGWCAPVNRIECATSSTCPPAYPICAQPWGCTCAGHNPDLGAFVTRSRKDYLLNDPNGIDTIEAVVTSRLAFQYFALAFKNIGVRDSGTLRYLGSLILKVSANACGTFSIGFVQEVDSTFIADPANPANAVLPVLQPLLLTVGDCSRQLLSCSPGHCNIDARIAHDRLNQNIRKNANQMVMAYSKSTTGMTAADFEVTVVPFAPDDEDDDVRTILNLTPDPTDPKTTTVTLNRPIRQTRWTCIRDKGSNKHCCMGSLPADADNSRISRSDDVFEVVNNLKGCLNPPNCSEPLLPLERCDTDRSLRCTGADLLMVVDLLTGADAFNEVASDSLPLFYINPPNAPYECPTMRLPP